MDIGKAFRFVFDDPEWISKVLIGGIMFLLGTVIIGFFFLLGYFVELVKNVRDGVEHPLPRWDNLGDKAVKGFKLAIIYLIWALPIIALSLLVSLVTFAIGDSQGAQGIAAILSACVGLLTLLWTIVLALASPAIVIRFAETGEFSAGFQFGQIFGFVSENIGNIIIALLISFVASLVAGLVGALLCGIGTFFTYFWAMAVEFHLFGQIARQASPDVQEATITV